MKITSYLGTLRGVGSLTSFKFSSNSYTAVDLGVSNLVVLAEAEAITNTTAVRSATNVVPRDPIEVTIDTNDIYAVGIKSVFTMWEANAYLPAQIGISEYSIDKDDEDTTTTESKVEETEGYITSRDPIEVTIDTNGIYGTGKASILGKSQDAYIPAEIGIEEYVMSEDVYETTSTSQKMDTVSIEILKEAAVSFPWDFSTALFVSGTNISTILGDVSDQSNSITVPEYGRFRFAPTLMKYRILGYLIPNTVNVEYIALNGITFYIRTRFLRNANDKYEARYITEFGIEEGSYTESWTSKTHTFTESDAYDAVNTLNELAEAEINGLKNHLNTVIGVIETDETTTIEYTTIPVGLAYNYRVSYMTSQYVPYQSGSATVTITMTYGQNGSYNNTYSTKQVTITPSNYSEYSELIETEVLSMYIAIQNYLNTLIGTVNVPTTMTRTVTTVSSKPFYLRTVFTKSSSSTTQCVMNYVTSYGPTTSYGTTFSSKSYTITASNYVGYTEALMQLATTELNSCENTSFAIWNVEIPEAKEVIYTNQGGLTYYIKCTYTQGATTNSTNVIGYRTTYGSSYEGNTTTQFSNLSFTVNSSTVGNALTSLDQLGNEEIRLCKEKLDIPNITCPANTSESYTKNGFTYTLLIAHTKGNQINIVNTALYIDGAQYGSTISTSFFTTQADAETELAALVTTKMNELKSACNASPADVSTSYNKGDCNYSIGTVYTKNAGSQEVTIKTMCDGAVYKTRKENVRAGTIANNLSTCSTNAAADLNTLRTALSAGPANESSNVTINGLGFTIAKTYNKTAGNTTMSYTIKVDGVTADSGSGTISASDISSSFSSIASSVSTKTTAINTTITTAVNNLLTTSSTITQNGFNYSLGGGVSKTAGSTTASSYVVLDGANYGSTSYTLAYNTLSNNITSLNSNITSRKNALTTIINASPANSSETYTVNGFAFTVGTLYSKAANSDLISIQTTLDGRTYKSQTQETTPSTLSNDLTTSTALAGAGVSELKLILDECPSDSDTTVYQVGSFIYYCGAVYSKDAGDQSVTVVIKLDGATNETYTTSIGNITTAQDIASLKSTVANKIAVLTGSLRGLDTTEETHTVGGFSFSLTATYAKNNDDGTITIRGYMDGVEYGTATVETFNPNNLSDYEEIGEDKIDAMKTAVSSVPSNVSQTHNVNGFSFTAGVSYNKAAGTDIVNIYRMLDGSAVGNPTSVRFDPNNILAISSRGTQELANLKATLNTCPANYAVAYDVGQMSFNVGSTFSKTAGSSVVVINTTLDGDVYGGAKNVTFDIGNIVALTTEASAKEAVLKGVLDQAPVDTTITHTVYRCDFNITKTYAKAAGSKNVTTFIKLDGVQYDQVHQEVYNIMNLNSLTGYNDTLATQLMSRLDSIIPNDIHTTYTRNGFNFTIDALFSKASGTDVVTITYLIDSANVSSTNTSTSNLLNG